VSSVWITFEAISSRFICATTGAPSSAAAPTQSHNVERDSETPWRAKIPVCRASGRWSAYLLTTTWARSPGPGRPFSIGWGGAGAVTTPSSQLRQAQLPRTVWSTKNEAGTYSSCSLTSSPMRARAPPQPRHWRSSSGGSIVTRLRGRSSGRRFLPCPRRRPGGGGSSCGSSSSSAAAGRNLSISPRPRAS